MKLIKFSISLLLLCVVSCFASASQTIVAGWGLPNTYADGSPLPKANVAGFELRYQKVGDPSINRVLITGSDRTSYEMDLPTDDIYLFSIATYDIAGNYSDFTSYTYDGVVRKPGQTYLSVYKKFTDANTSCSIDVNCKIVP